MKLFHNMDLIIYSYTLFLIILGIFDFQALQQADRVLGKKKNFDKNLKFLLSFH